MAVRSLAGASAVAMVVASGLVLGPQAQAAHADVVPPPVVSVPSSVLAAEAGTATSAEAVGTLTASGGAAVGTGVAATGVAAAEAASGTALAGLVIGTTAGSQIAKVIGLPTSGNFICDVQLLIWTDSGCATVPGAGRVINSDVTVNPQDGTVLPNGTG